MIAVFLLLPVWIGYLAVRCIWPQKNPSWRFFAVQFFLGIGVGFGLTSALSYMLLASGHFATGPQLLAEIAVALV